jgi:polar amino acid transport system substrate-binding protein
VHVNNFAIEGEGAAMFAVRCTGAGDPPQTNAHLAAIWISQGKTCTGALHRYDLCDNRRRSYSTITKKKIMGYDDFPRAARTLACALLLLAGGAAAAGTPMTVRVLAQESIPPKWIMEGGIAQGLCPDLMAAIERIEPRIHFVGYDHGRSLLVIEDALDSGKASAACGLLDSPRRRSVAVRMQVPLYEVKHRLAAVASDVQVVNNLDELARLNPLINTARGSAYILQLKARGIAVDDSTGDNAVNLRKIVAGHGRYTYMNELSLLYLIRTEHLEGKVRMLPAVFNAEPVYFWVSRKADPSLAPVLDQAIARLKANGELARIYDRWAQPK